MLPDQAPPALHEMASVEDQVRVEDPLLLTDEGLAVRDTVGVGDTDDVESGIAITST